LENFGGSGAFSYNKRMNSEQLRALQAPLKTRYRETPEAALVTLRARSKVGDDQIACNVETGKALITAGLPPGAGGDGTLVCSGDMLLEALVGCAGTTLKAVATALNIPLKSGRVEAEGDLDLRGTLGIAKDAPVGFRAIRLRIDLDTDAPAEQVAKLVELTERYCVVYQTLRGPSQLSVTHQLQSRP
jgi:uncharacterized OsmC-like protein